jgi:hypothetical protein
VTTPQVLVLGRLVNPSFTAAVDVTQPHHGYLARPHASDPLELDHRLDHERQERQRGIDVLIGDWLNGIGFSGG